MKSLRYGSQPWRRYLAARQQEGGASRAVQRTAAGIVRDVRRNGDAALVRLTQRLDGVRLRPSELRVPAADVRAHARRASPAVRRALRAMAARIEEYHRRQLAPGFRLRLFGGSVVEEVVRPLDSVGLYVPGGAGAYPSSVLMAAIPARVAGVRRVVIATPPRTLATNPAVAAAIALVGLEGSVLRVGGAQAIAALAFGTESVRPVAKIVGPGNAYVAAAKRLVRGPVDVDQEAGPSEVVVLADDSAEPALVAADLLAQAEHGSGAETVVLVTPSAELAREVSRLVAAGLAGVANIRAARRALATQGAVVLVRDLQEGVCALNDIAPEHAQVIARGAGRISRDLVAGAVFVGPYSPSAVGDYGIGPNHVLPTGGSARHSSPLSVRDFQRRHSAVRMTRAGLSAVAPGMATAALAEGFRGHAKSLLARLQA